MQILIKKPCSASWEDMTPGDRGRLCAACNKEVIDFTAMSDVEIMKYLSPGSVKTESRRKTAGQEQEAGWEAAADPREFPYPGKVCGRFLPAQLGRDLTPPARQRKWAWSDGWQWLFLFLIFHEKAKAQRQVPEVVHAPPKEVKVMGDTILTGIPLVLPPAVLLEVTDHLGHPMEGAVVTVEGEKKKYVTGKTGQIAITYKGQGNSSRLSVSSIGYVTGSVKIRWPKGEGQVEAVRVTLQLLEILMGEVEVVEIR